MKYGVRLRGENFEIISDSVVENLGFFTTRFVKAIDPEDAEIKAVNMIRTDQSLLSLLAKERKFEPKIYLVEFWPESWWKPIGGKGYTFYSMDAEE